MATGASNLGSQLGQLLFGQPDDNKAYYEGQALGSLVNDRMASASANRADAMLKQTRNNGLNALRQSYKSLGYTDQQSDVMANSAMANGGENLQTAIGSALMAQIPVAGHGPVPQSADTFQQALGRETTKLIDGQLIDPFGSSTQAVPLTALGTATVGEKNASAADKQASAGEHTAHAHLFNVQADAGGFNPHEGKGGAGNPTTPSQGLLGAVLGTGLDEMGHPIIDQAKMRRFLAFQENNAATDPRYNDGDYALRQWAAQSENPPVVTAPASSSAPVRLGDATTGKAPAKVGGSPYPEGTRLTGPGGKLYEVRNGQPVEVSP